MADEKPFDKFQLEEYKNISTAHFESIKQISTFFRYYLLILAASVFILNIVSSKEGGIASFLQGNAMPIYYNVVFFYFLAVAIIGFFIFLYVINLSLDAVLYARAVNKVRKYFYDNSELNITDYEKYLQLPVVSTKPKYSEKTFFVPLLFVFSIINCGLLYSAFALKATKSNYFGEWKRPLSFIFAFDLPINTPLILILVLIFFLLHVAGYFVLGQMRNNYYLKNYLIGIDIDGVLNNQTLHFAKWLKELRGITLDETKLKEIPVSLNSGIGISDFDEKVVFNTKEYWESLPQKDNAAMRVNDFPKRFGFKILFFSYRDWPQYGSREVEIRSAITEKGYHPIEKGEITTVTSKWLKANNITAVMIKGFLSSSYYYIVSLFKGNKRAVIEVGNPYISDTRFWNHFRKSILNRNRFQGASIKGFRFFSEDTPENAIKLSSLCEYVFMFDEPYNAADNYSFPKNVIRVKSWTDIYRHLKTLS